MGDVVPHRLTFTRLKGLDRHPDLRYLFRLPPGERIDR
jgi:hypothetical protein